MKKLYEFRWDCGRMGFLESLFIAEEEDVDNLIGQEVFFGECLGKHSDIHGVIEDEDIKVKSEDQDFISKLIDVLGDGTISGHNPLDYVEEEYEEEE